MNNHNSIGIVSEFSDQSEHPAIVVNITTFSGNAAQYICKPPPSKKKRDRAAMPPLPPYRGPNWESVPSAYKTQPLPPEPFFREEWVGLNETDERYHLASGQALLFLALGIFLATLFQGIFH